MKEYTEDELVELLFSARDAYYNGLEPIMSDDQFDNLEEKLKKINPENSYFKKIGIETEDDQEKVTHAHPMLSSNKVKNIIQLKDWIDRLKLPTDTEWIIEPKIDGISCSILYQKGKLVHIATRGNGYRGKNITYINHYTKHFPTEIKNSIFSKIENLEIRGELFLSKKDDFAKKEENKNRPLRNLCAGLINRKEKRDEIKSVKFLAYGIYPNGILKSESEKIEELSRTGFSVIPYFLVRQINEIENNLNEYLHSLREKWEFETDGLIISINDNNLFEEINSRWIVDRHNHYVIAVKPPPVYKITKLLDVHWQISRFGNLIPVAIFESVRIGGAVIQKATLNNLNNVKEMLLQREDELKVERANDVIPYVAENITGKSDFERKDYDPSLIPDHCPSCSTKLKETGIHLICPNGNCPERRIQQILFWVQKSGMENIAEKTIRFLYEKSYIKSIKDLYTVKKEDLLDLDGFQEKKAENFIHQIKKTKRMSFEDFISSLGISGVQKKSLIKLKILGLKEFLDFDDDTYVIGQNIIEWKNQSANIELLQELISFIKFSESNSEKGRKVVFTGKGPFSRKEAEKKATEMGYLPTSTVSKDLNILVTDDLNRASSKMKKAKQYGIEVLTYEDFFQI